MFQRNSRPGSEYRERKLINEVSKVQNASWKEYKQYLNIGAVGMSSNKNTLSISPHAANTKNMKY